MQPRMPQKITHASCHPGLGIICAEQDSAHPGKNYGARALCAGLERDTECRTVEAISLQDADGTLDGQQFRMLGEIALHHGLVVRLTDDVTVNYDGRPDWNLTGCGCCARFVEGDLHAEAFCLPEWRSLGIHREETYIDGRVIEPCRPVSKEPRRQEIAS